MKRFALFRWTMSLLLAALPAYLAAHPMPSSVVLLTVHADRLEAEVQVPLSELEAALQRPVSVDRDAAFLRGYFREHFRVFSPDGKPWAVSTGALSVAETQNPVNGTYRELVALLTLVPGKGGSTRRFSLMDDVVLHQVVTHKILVSVREDWENGRLADAPPMQAGVIALDIVNNRMAPLTVDLEQGSYWKGFSAMVRLGMEHIAEGTDHLLFLLVLLLPAPLLFAGKRWGGFGGVRHAVWHLLGIVTAFTAGHSLTLLLGALGWVQLPSQPVELLIAVSILVSAVHAWRPLFPGKEAWVAAGFGLIHGLAFAETLSHLSLDTGPMVLSIFGFNLGIEVMQLAIIAVVIPVLLLLSRTPAYAFVRVGGAAMASLAAVVWIAERAGLG